MRILLMIVALFTFSANADDGWHKAQVKDNLMHIPIVLNGIETTAILDTGSITNYISKDFIAKHGQSLPKGGVTKIASSWDDERYQIYNKVPVTLFDTMFEMDDLIESDIPSGDLVIGMHFFRFFILQIDYPNQRVRMLDRKSVNMKKFKNIESRVEGDHGVPIVKLEVNGEKDAWFLLDTATTVGLKIERGLSEQRDWLTEYRKSRISLKDINRIEEMTELNIPKVQFGPFQLENITSAVPDKGHSLDLRPRYEKGFSRIKGKRLKGAVGFDVLKHFVITIEYQTGFIHIGA
jgi:hypothetical protein